MEVRKVGRAVSHGFPSTSDLCWSQTRLTTNGHLATYFAARVQRCASQSLLSKVGSNSGPRLFVSIAAPIHVRREHYDGGGCSVKRSWSGGSARRVFGSSDAGASCEG